VYVYTYSWLLCIISYLHNKYMHECKSCVYVMYSSLVHIPSYINKILILNVHPRNTQCYRQQSLFLLVTDSTFEQLFQFEHFPRAVMLWPP
jgi:hypothetical protein